MFSSPSFSDDSRAIYLIGIEGEKLENYQILLLKELYNGQHFANFLIEKQLYRVQQIGSAFKVLNSDMVDEVEKFQESCFKFRADILFEDGISTYPILELRSEFEKLTPIKLNDGSKDCDSENGSELLSRIELLEKKVEKLETLQYLKLGKSVEELLTVSENSRFWRDPETNLSWEIKERENRNRVYSYEEAQLYIDELNRISFGGYSNWRIPTKAELQTLFSREKEGDNYIKPPLSKDIPQYRPLYWSCTESENKPLFLWVGYFHQGYGDYRYQTHSYYIRAVRG
jgi:hypothetical protein